MRGTRRANRRCPRALRISGRWSVTSTPTSPGAHGDTQRQPTTPLPHEGASPTGSCGHSQFPVENKVPVERAVEKMAQSCGLSPGDLDVHRGGYLGVQPYL